VFLGTIGTWLPVNQPSAAADEILWTGNKSLSTGDRVLFAANKTFSEVDETLSS